MSIIFKSVYAVALRAASSSIGTFIKQTTNCKYYFFYSTISFVSLMSVSNLSANAAAMDVASHNPQYHNNEYFEDLFDKPQAEKKKKKSKAEKKSEIYQKEKSTTSNVPKVEHNGAPRAAANHIAKPAPYNPSRYGTYSPQNSAINKTLPDPGRRDVGLDAYSVLHKKPVSIFAEVAGGGVPPSLNGSGSSLLTSVAPAISLDVVMDWYKDFYWSLRLGYELNNWDAGFLLAFYNDLYVRATRINLHKFTTKSVIGFTAGANIISVGLGVNYLQSMGVMFKHDKNRSAPSLYGVELDLGYERLLTRSISVSAQLAYEVYLAEANDGRIKFLQAVSGRLGLVYKFGS